MLAKNTIRISKLGAAIALASAPGVLLAQDSKAPSLEEIVVTAERRESNAQTTAISMKVVGTEELADAGVRDLSQINNIAPTVNIAQNNENLLITIRGVSSRDYTETGDPAVAVSLDNFYMQDSIGLNAAMFDVDRIEVLRGPQGTLYGRNATAGALNISSVKPTDELGGNLSVEYGNYEEKRVEGALNLPINDKMSMRVAGMARDNGGYRDNGSGLDDGDQNTTYAARVHLAYYPTDRLSTLFTYEYVDMGGVGTAAKAIFFDEVKADGTLDLGDQDSWDLNTQGYVDVELNSFRTNVTYDFENLSVMYSGGVQLMDFERLKDQDGSAVNSLGWLNEKKAETQNHEIRVVSSFSGPLNFQSGIYYFKQETTDQNSYFQVYSAGNDPFNFFSFEYDTSSESKAVFGQASYDLSDTLQFELGVRYTEDKKLQKGRDDIGVGTFRDIYFPYEGDKVTWHTGVNWSPLIDHFFYAKVDRGYKAGGYKNVATYNPEEITSYEIGSKSRFFDNSLQLNTSLYYYDYTDMQVLQTLGSSGISAIFNAGKASIYGADIEVTYLFSMQDKLDLSLAYVQAEYDEFCTVTAAECPAESDYSGNTLPQAPELTAILGYSHDFVFGNSVLTASWKSKYQSRSYFSYFNNKTEQQESYIKSDLTLAYQREGSPGKLTAYVRNIEDRRILNMSERVDYAGGYLVQFAAPRTLGVRFDYEF